VGTLPPTSIETTIPEGHAFTPATTAFHRIGRDFSPGIKRTGSKTRTALPKAGVKRDARND
jgi:hypothetical protein